MNIKHYLESKNYGFYVSLAVSLLMLISGIVYQALFGAARDYSVGVMVVMVIGFAFSVVLLVLKQDKLVPYALGIFALTGLLLFVSSIYLYVSEVMVGIDYEKALVTPFIAVTILYALTFVGALVNCWFPQLKKVETPAEEKSEEVESHE